MDVKVSCEVNLSKGGKYKEEEEKNYKRVKPECTQCQKIFYHRGTLNRHIKEVCNKSKLVNEDSTPQRYLPKVQDKIKLKCPLCEFVGIGKESVLLHIRNTHGGKLKQSWALVLINGSSI